MPGFSDCLRELSSCVDRSARFFSSIFGAGAAARLAACTTEIDKWCLAQAKDLEIREEVSCFIRVLFSFLAVVFSREKIVTLETNNHNELDKILHS